MADIIDWNKLKNGGDEKLLFERFCFHISEHMFGQYGSMSYFYNTPGSEFYLTVNVQFEHEGIIYNPGDVIGWQAKFWRGAKDDNNSPLGSDHRNELVEGFKKTKNYRPAIKLWITCTPGCFVQKNWDLLTDELSKIDPNCMFESWHKDIFEGFYLKDSNSVNGVFKYYFGELFIDKNALIDISKDTLSVLKNKFDVDLHTPCEIEKTLLGIVDKKQAFSKLGDVIRTTKRHADKDKKSELLSEGHWGYELLSERFKDLFVEDCHCRYELLDRIFATYTGKGDNLSDKIFRIANSISEYRANRVSRVDELNKEINIIYSKHHNEYGNLDYYLNELASKITSLEKFITGGEGFQGDSLISVTNLISQKDFSIFAQAGYGKTHLACSLAENMINRNLPVIFFTGGMFRQNDGFEFLFRRKLDLSDAFSFNDILDTLDFIGEINGCKLPIIIDGLNESAPNEGRWKEDLPILRRKIKERSNLLLITTCREKEEYIEIIYGLKDYKRVDNHITLQGLLDTNIDVVINRYFTKYNIVNATVTQTSVFENPLLLKIFCLTNKGRSNLVVNEYSLASCMKAYSEQLLDSIAIRNGRFDRIVRHKLEGGLDNIARLIWERNNRAVDFFDEFAPLFDEYTEEFLKEGMCFSLDNNRGEEQVQFTYDMVAGYHIAKYILGTCRDVESFREYVTQNSSKFFGEGRHTLAEDVVKCLFYLLPEKYGQEWIEITPSDDVVKASINNLDILFATDEGKNALVSFLGGNKLNEDVLDSIIGSLRERFIVHRSIGCVSLLIEFFTGLSNKDLDKYWNSHYAKYHEMQEAFSVLHDKFNSSKYALEDKLTYSLLMSGMTDKEFRQKFYRLSVKYALEDRMLSIGIFRRMIFIDDPFIREIIFSVVTCIGLRSYDVEVVNECILVLEDFLEKFHSTNVVLLDDLETLYSYAENIDGREYDRTKLYLGLDKEWPVGNIEEMKYVSFYSYDFDKFNIRPLYTPGYDETCEYNEEEIYGMLLGKITGYGYDKVFYRNLENQEYENTKYRRDQKVSYSFKYGREALMELYGWLLLNGKLQNEFKGTFRTSLIDIDPSTPQFPTKKTLISDYLLPCDVSSLAEWMKGTLTDKIKRMSVCQLPDRSGDWVLLRGYCRQSDSNVHSQIYFSLTSQLVPKETTAEELNGIHLNDEVDYSHAFSSELGWRDLEFTEEYDDEKTCEILLARYGFRGWSQERFDYPSYSCISPYIAKEVGLIFDMGRMSYYKGEEEVSAYYVNDSDMFFYLRKDIVDKILERFDSKIRHHIYEYRMVDKDLPADAPEISDQFVQHDEDCFYDNRS